MILVGASSASRTRKSSLSVAWSPGSLSLPSPTLDPKKLCLYAFSFITLHEKGESGSQGRSHSISYILVTPGIGQGWWRIKYAYLWNIGRHVSCVLYSCMCWLSGSQIYYTICLSYKVEPGQRNNHMALFKHLVSMYWEGKLRITWW